MARRADVRDKIDRDLIALTHRVHELEDLAGQVGDKIRETLSLEHHVAERPWTCLAVAFIAGLVLGRSRR